MSNYLQPVFQFPDAPGGRLSIFIAGSTDLADVFDPTSGAVISNPVAIDTAGYAAPFHVDADKAYDLVVKDFGGATVLTVNNVAVASGGGGAGTPGPQGPRGPIGLTGAPGKDGTNGANGVDGVDGEDGAPGAPGVGLSRIVVDPESTTGRILYSFDDSPEEWHDAGSIMPAGQGMVKTSSSDSLGYLEQKIQAGTGVAVETDGQKITLSSTYEDDHKTRTHTVSTLNGYLSELIQAGTGVQVSMDASYNKIVISATGTAVGGWQWGGTWDNAKAYNLNTAVWYLDNTLAVPVNRLYIATAANQGVNPYADAGVGTGSVWSCMVAVDYLGDQFVKLAVDDLGTGYLADKLKAGNNIVLTRVDEAAGSHYEISTVAPYQVLVGTTLKEYNQLYGTLEFVGAGGCTAEWNGRGIQIRGLALGTTATTAARGDQGLTAYNHSQASGNPHGTTAAQISCTATGDVSATNVQAAIAELASEKQTVIAAGTTSQFFRGDKTWQDLAGAVRSVVLTGLAAGTNVAIAATDSILGAFSKVQAQITALVTTVTSHLSNTSNPHGVTKAQVGLGSVDNTSDANKPVSAAQQTALNTKLARDGSQTMTGNLIFQGVGGTESRFIQLGMGNNDLARVMAGANGENDGWLEIATADDGQEPIYLRQYTGVFSTVKRSATLLDAVGNTQFPGTVTAPTFSGNFSGNAATATALTTSNAGDANTPVYFSGGKPVACTSLDLYSTGGGDWAQWLYNAGNNSGRNIDTLLAPAGGFRAFVVTNPQSTAGLPMTTSWAFITEQVHVDTAHALQTFTDYWSNRQFIRRRDAGSWKPWAELATTGGNVATATALTTNAGGASTPVYFSGGKPVACTSLNLSTSGNAATASKLATARTITLTGDVTGSAPFDGSANINISATVTDNSHSHVVGDVSGLDAHLNARARTFSYKANSIDGINLWTLIASFSPGASTTYNFGISLSQAGNDFPWSNAPFDLYVSYRDGSFDVRGYFTTDRAAGDIYYGVVGGVVKVFLRNWSNWATAYGGTILFDSHGVVNFASSTTTTPTGMTVYTPLERPRDYRIESRPYVSGQAHNAGTIYLEY